MLSLLVHHVTSRPEKVNELEYRNNKCMGHVAHVEELRNTYKTCGPCSSVGIATDYGLNGPESNPGWNEIFRPSRSALGPTQLPAYLGTGSFPGIKCGQGVLLTTHPLLVPRSWKSRVITLSTLWSTPGQ